MSVTQPNSAHGSSPVFKTAEGLSKSAMRARARGQVLPILGWLGPD
jgi:hypothetical protein